MWQPALTPKWVILTFIVLGIIFIPIGAALLYAATTAYDATFRYDELAGVPNHVNASSTTFNLTVTHDMTPPVYFYYKLGNFYQNHRRYVTSESIYQLHGDDQPDLSTCSPELWEYNWLNYPQVNNGNLTEYSIYPCGAIAGSFFNDTFSVSLLPRAGGVIPLGSPQSDPGSRQWEKNDIAYSSDLDTLYQINEDWIKDSENPTLVTEGGLGITRIGTWGFLLPLINDSDFAVWQRVAPLPVFKKLYRVIHCVPSSAASPTCSSGGKLYAGDVLQVTVTNNFDVNPYSGSKSVVISTVSWLGGTNRFLGIVWIVVGGLCFAFAIVFALKTLIDPPPVISEDTRVFELPDGGGQMTLNQPTQH